MKTVETNRAVVVDPQAPGRLAIHAVAEPAAGQGDVLVRVRAFSLNRGEVRRAQVAPAGWRPGWDFSGEVIRAAAGGQGPREGTRVVGVVSEGAWAERLSAPLHAIASLPDNVSFSRAATLPVAGLTALHALSKGGLLLGKRVLITGASGGVGDFLVQLASHSGAHVTANVRRQDQANAMQQLGAREVLVAEEIPMSPKYDLIVDSVGGRTLGTAMGALQKGGVCVSFGVSASADATFDPRQFFGTGRATLYGLTLFNELPIEPASIGLARLLDLLSGGHISPTISVERSWSDVARIADDLMERRFSGKAVLTID